MSLRITFLMSKDPTVDRGGDVEMSKLAMDLATEAGHDVRCICLSTQTASHDATTPALIRVPKPPVSALAIGLRSARTGHSLVHSRFDQDAVVAAIDSTAAATDVYVAEHSYMAEPYLRSRGVGQARLLVNTHAAESVIWGQLHGVVGRLDRRRITADEARVARAAHSVASFDREEVDDLRRRGIRRPVWLDLTLRPSVAAPVIDSRARLVFVGSGEWPPNIQAAQILRGWWPEISAGIDDAQLLIVGGRGIEKRVPNGDPSIKEIGFVPDLDELLASCRALAAPIQLGGGVRVKVLNAASLGLPVVTTSVGLGSLGEIFGIEPADGKASFVKRCRAYLQSSQAAAVEGARLYQANAEHWRSGRPLATLASWWAA